MRRMIAPQLLAWWDKHGRKHLPWQKDRTPYRIWVSEIMLQQTRVETVMPYFERFMASFPDVQALAAAHDDDVLAIWAGLGYYTRVHNLLKAARIVIAQHGGELPSEFDSLVALPGIGRSTAGAIVALAHDQRSAILDGNARRVLARVHAVEGWPGKASIGRKLWDLAEANTPSERVRDYTQAIMDLGATVCLRRNPRCDACPLAGSCRARTHGLTAQIPASKPKANRPLKRRSMLMVQRPDGAVLLCRRPAAGIWAGLWCLPTLGDVESIADWCGRVLGCSPRGHAELAPVRHGFSHFELEIRPIHLPVSIPSGEIQEGDQWRWHDGTQDLGMPAPIRRLVESLEVGAAGSR
ncbi:MAG: A/G-specific adenine glycosylase [Gammaproteobacteria bacterium]|nr:A/G-specific adenine glycosylase [Gammaproteobacteria bacterium]MYL01435.1 A/G-specific adenine glycosylase [Gammaproteobacteria bacterium]